ncbi:ankyrin repeat domain-containing protein [Burkholderia contaminans]|uniref:ankyrin repeat domain-containing protein n=1 Tax=Burkholderia contaminans TaxID=488447 RepID=UPI001CF5F076|nr:ankyrin repeat domain-containing protein [Burkholderia contaminans]MCA7920798.1 ankyrin repeat domain-containing protein [Burkholderia contaminans]UUX37262.1 ankyrin repeat domain-containing protein [Burkholderia contaminans]
MIEFDFPCDPKPITPERRMFLLARGGDVTQLSGLCDAQGVAPSDVFDGSKSLLFTAAENCQIEMCEWLISRGVSIAHQDRSGRTALLSAICIRDGEWKQKLVSTLAGAVNIPDNFGLTPLMRATRGAGAFGAHRGNLKLVKALIAHGADVFAQDLEGLTALGHAIRAANASKRDINEDIIMFLENSMVEAAAILEFRRLYKHHFSNSGVLMLRHRD